MKTKAKASSKKGKSTVKCVVPFPLEFRLKIAKLREEEGYIGHSVAERKQIPDRQSFAQRIMQEGEDPVQIKMTAEELQEICDRWCSAVYHHNAHTRAKIKSGRITEENRQKILQALGPLRRKKAKRVVYTLTPKTLITLSTRERPVISCSAAELRRGDKTAFIPPGCDKTISDEQLEFFREVEDPDGDFRAGREILSNSHDYKTPCNIAIADATPERRFIRQLCERQNANALDAWIKNAAQRYYAIEYAWKKGEHPKRGEFSPDFFIKKDDMIYVVEIKDDPEITDPSVENQKKFEYAQAHFERLNQWLNDTGKENRPCAFY